MFMLHKINVAKIDIPTDLEAKMIVAFFNPFNEEFSHTV